MGRLRPASLISILIVSNKATPCMELASIGNWKRLLLLQPNRAPAIKMATAPSGQRADRSLVFTGTRIAYLSRTASAKATPNIPSDSPSMSSPARNAGLWFNKRSNITATPTKIATLKRLNKDRVPAARKNRRFLLPFAKLSVPLGDTFLYPPRELPSSRATREQAPRASRSRAMGGRAAVYVIYYAGGSFQAPLF